MENPSEEQNRIPQVEFLRQEDIDAVSSLSRRARLQKNEITMTEEHLKVLNAAYRKTTDFDLPNLMTKAGLTTMGLLDGSRIEIKTVYQASISKTNQPAAFSWLRENNHGHMIKNTISCNFGANEDDKAAAFFQRLYEEGLYPEQKTSVAPSTLKARVKDMIQNGEDIPEDLLGVFVSERAIFKNP